MPRYREPLVEYHVLFGPEVITRQHDKLTLTERGPFLFLLLLIHEWRKLTSLVQL